jgi:hypothetical protein
MVRPPEKRVVASTQFLSEFDAASPGLQQLVVSEVRHLIDRMRQLPKTWLHAFDRVAGIKGSPVVEVKVGGGPRLLVSVDGAVILWHVGDHDIVSRTVKSRMHPPRREECRELPERFHREVEVFPPSAGRDIGVYGPEHAPEWTYFLDAEQHRLAIEFEDRVISAWASGDGWTGIIAGGPGTGKTAVLVWLLNQLKLLQDEFTIALVCSEAMRDYVEASIGWDLGQVWQPHAQLFEADLVLVDDPETLSWVQTAITIARAQGAATATVVAVDPLQCRETVTDRTFSSFVESVGAELRWLHTCYRQKAEVGRAAMSVAAVVAESSPFLETSKRKKFADGQKDLTARVNGIEFINPTGLVTKSDRPEPMRWADHIAMLMRLEHQGRLWQNWPSVLVVVDPAADVPSEWQRIRDVVDVEEVTLDQLEEIKGLEYQHVVLLLDTSTFDAVEHGVEGAGQNRYADLRRLRIPFTRARDSLATFVVSDSAPPVGRVRVQQ